MSSWDQANRGEKLGLVWRSRKKINQIINGWLPLLTVLPQIKDKGKQKKIK
jgi:hypothetical protein